MPAVGWQFDCADGNGLPFLAGAFDRLALPLASGHGIDTPVDEPAEAGLAEPLIAVGFRRVGHAAGDKDGQGE